MLKVNSQSPPLKSLDLIIKHTQKLNLSPGSRLWPDSMDCSPDNQHLAFNNGGKLQVFNLFTQTVKTLIENTDKVLRVKYSPNGQLIATSSLNGTIFFWNSKTLLQEGISLKEHQSSVHALDFSPDSSKLISASKDRRLRIFEKGTQIVNILVPIPISVQYSPDSKHFMAACIDNTIRVWRSETTKLVRSIRQLRGFTCSIQCTKNVIMIGSDDHRFRMWDQKKGKQLRRFIRHRGQIQILSESANLIITGDDEDIVRIFEYETAKQLSVQYGSRKCGSIFARFSADARNYLSISDDGTVRITKSPKQ